MQDSIINIQEETIDTASNNPSINIDTLSDLLITKQEKKQSKSTKNKTKTSQSKSRLKNIQENRDKVSIEPAKNKSEINTIDSCNKINKGGRPFGSTLQQAGEQAYKVLRPYVTRIYQAMLKGSRDGVTPTIQGKPVTAEQIKAARDLLPYVFPRLSQVDGSHNKANTINAVKVTVYTNENRPQNIATIERGCVLNDDRGKGDTVEPISVETVLNESGGNNA